MIRKGKRKSPINIHLWNGFKNMDAINKYLEKEKQTIANKCCGETREETPAERINMMQNTRIQESAELLALNKFLETHPDVITMFRLANKYGIR